MTKRALPLLVAGCFFVSGAAGLLYEVVWLRLLGLVFGHTVHAVTTVLAAYMGGLALGSLLLAKRADAVRRPLRAYALIEAAIGLYCLATPLLFGAADSAYLELFRALQPSAAVSVAIHFVFSAALLLVPTTLMGATLPLLGRALVDDPARTGFRVGTLYAVNTLGAVAGVASTGFVLLPGIGLRATVWLGVALNLLVAVVALLLDRSPGAGAKPSPTAASPAAPPPTFRRPVAAVALGAVAVAGAASMAYEIAWTRALSLVLGSSTYAFSAMLATFLTGLAFGAFAAARWLRRRPAGLVVFGLVECVIALLAVALLPLFGRLPEIFLALVARQGLSHGSALLAQFGLSFLVMILPTLLMGAALPLALAALARGPESVGRDVGRVYGANTLGTIAGSAVAGFALVPLVGIRNAVVVAACANLVAGLAVLAVAERRRWLRPAFVVLPAALAALVAVLPDWDRRLLSSGVAVYAATYLGNDVRQVAAEREILFYEEGVNTTVAVLRRGEQLTLTVNGKADGGNGSDMATQILLGQLPALLAPDARRALVIGLGTGVTAGTLAGHPLESIEVAELEPAMVTAARFFARENHDVLRDPRVRVVEGDGRHILAAAAQPYDLVISEPSNPWIAGVGNLFTREFYAAARARLSPRGLVVQWLQNYQIFPADMQMVVRTFREVFPHTTVWRGARGDYLLVGSPQPLRFDLPAMQRRLAQAPRARADLAALGMEPEDLLGRFALGEEEAARYAQGAALNTDDLPLLEFSAPRALYSGGSTRENEQLLESFHAGAWPEVAGLDPAQLRTPEYLLRRARDAWHQGRRQQAEEWLGRLRDEGADQPWGLERARLLFALGRLGQAAGAFEALERAGRRDPSVSNHLAACRALQQRDLTIKLMHVLLAVPADGAAQAHEGVGRALVDFAMETGERALVPVAREHLQAAIDLGADGPELLNTTVLVLLESGARDEAHALAGRFAAAHPQEALAHFALGLALEARQLPAQARREFQEAQRLAPQWEAPREKLGRP